MYALLELIFGKEGLMVFLDAVASVHEGVAKPDVLMQELNDIFEACKLKN